MKKNAILSVKRFNFSIKILKASSDCLIINFVTIINGLLVVFTAIAKLLGLLVGLVFAKLLCIALAVLIGWTAGLFIGDTVLALLEQLGITGFSMAQIGAFLGFIVFFTHRYAFQISKAKNKSHRQKTQPHINRVFYIFRIISLGFFASKYLAAFATEQSLCCEIR